MKKKISLGRVDLGAQVNFHLINQIAPFLYYSYLVPTIGLAEELVYRKFIFSEGMRVRTTKVRIKIGDLVQCRVPWINMFFNDIYKFKFFFTIRDFIFERSFEASYAIASIILIKTPQVNESFPEEDLSFFVYQEEIFNNFFSFHDSSQKTISGIAFEQKDIIKNFISKGVGLFDKYFYTHLGVPFVVDKKNNSFISLKKNFISFFKQPLINRFNSVFLKNKFLNLFFYNTQKFNSIINNFFYIRNKGPTTVSNNIEGMVRNNSFFNSNKNINDDYYNKFTSVNMGKDERVEAINEFYFFIKRDDIGMDAEDNNISLVEEEELSLEEAFELSNISFWYKYSLFRRKVYQGFIFNKVRTCLNLILIGLFKAITHVDIYKLFFNKLVVLISFFKTRLGRKYLIAYFKLLQQARAKAQLFGKILSLKLFNYYLCGFPFFITKKKTIKIVRLLFSKQQLLSFFIGLRANYKNFFIKRLGNKKRIRTRIKVGRKKIIGSNIADEEADEEFDEDYNDNINNKRFIFNSKGVSDDDTNNDDDDEDSFKTKGIRNAFYSREDEDEEDSNEGTSGDKKKIVIPRVVKGGRPTFIINERIPFITYYSFYYRLLGIYN